MTDAAAAKDAVPCEPDLDENGVDLAQVRAMLDLSPTERVRVIEELVDSIALIRALNDARSIR